MENENLMEQAAPGGQAEQVQDTAPAGQDMGSAGQGAPHGDAGQTPAVGSEGAPAAPVPEDAAPAGGQADETGRPAAKPTQSPEENRRFAETRRRDAVFRELMGDAINPQTGKVFADLDEFRAWKQHQRMQLQAREAGLDPQAYERVHGKLVQEVREQLLHSDPELQAQREALEQYRRKDAEQQFSADLAAIRKEYPDEKAGHVAELGDDFMAMMATGKVSALAAYRAVREQRRLEQPAPASMGDVKPGGENGAELYTPEQVRRMSPAEVHKNYDKIQRSMKSWKT